MVGELIAIYLCAWLVFSTGMYVLRGHLSDGPAPAQHPLVLCIVGGAFWPLLLLGAVELSGVAVYAKRHAKPESDFGALV